MLDLPDTLRTTAQALGEAERLLAAMVAVMRPRRDDIAQAAQADAHGLAWAATSVQAMRQMGAWAQALHAAGRCQALEQHPLSAFFAETLAQLAGGLAMSQGETFRPAHLARNDTQAFAADPNVQRVMEQGFDAATRTALAQALAQGAATREFGQHGHADPGLEEIRSPFARFADDHADAAHQWHLRDELIPDAVLAELARLGVFGLTVGEEHGGLGLGKQALCVVTEELSRAHIGLGSLGTRTEIAAEIITGSGTPAQQAHWLPRIADGSCIPTACFTEPDVGSDLASIQTRAVRTATGWQVFGNKTWITHGARSDVMTLMARTGERGSGYKGLSMFLAAKPRGSDAAPFPAPGMQGGEIPVLGYRGMKEYDIAFDGFAMAPDALLGGEEGQGFKQLMRTFESARIQTAARAVGVAQNAMELGLGYAMQRKQFGQTLIAFPRVADKLAWMAAEVMAARQLTLFAASEKDAGRRCDLEAGMAKLFAARTAWSAADNALQIHGGNGYAQEYRISRVLCDARILSVFEGAAEIQAGIIAKALLQ